MANSAEQCTFTSETGERCTERGFLEIDHIIPAALGGRPTVDNLRLLCGPHNQYEAKRKLGADFMAAKRAQAKVKAAADDAVMVTNHEPTTAKPFESELVDALTSLGYKAAEARRAVANIADAVDATFESRLRTALASLSRSRPIRCSDGPFDLSMGLPLWVALQNDYGALRNVATTGK
jgi:hypothetical protein